MRELEQIPPRLLRALAAAPIIPEAEIGNTRPPRTSLLTFPEKRVLSLLSHGLTEQMTAELLGKSLETVKTQTKTARRRLRAKNTHHAIALALRSGEIT